MMKQNILFLWLSLATASQVIGEEQPRDLGVALPLGAKKIGEHRYQSPRTYEDTLREFHQRFLKSDFIKLMGEEINLPQVRATSYKNIDPHGKFYAINIYLNVQTGLTEIFLVENIKVATEKK